MEEFQVLGELVEKRWRQQNYSEQQFPDLAAQALKESNLPERVGELKLEEVQLLK